MEEMAKEQLRKRIEDNLLKEQPATTKATQPITSGLIGILTDTVEKSLKEELKITHSLGSLASASKSDKLDEDEESFLDNEMENHKCGICFETMADSEHEPMIVVPCGHCFCKNCLKLLSKQQCPTCR